MTELSIPAAPLLGRARWPVVLPLLGYVIFISESAFAGPNWHWALLLLVWTAGATLIAWWLTRPAAAPGLDRLERHAAGIAVAVIVLAALGFVAVSVFQARFFALGAHAEDTAYYSQVLWNTLHGDFLSGNVQQERLYNPPVSSDFALHVSGALLGLLPLYAVAPHFMTLLVVRDVALAAAAWPLFLLARERISGTAGVAAVVLYLLNPAVIVQSAEAFYPLQLAPLPFFWALRAFVREDFGVFFLATAAAISTREDVAIAMMGFGVWALVWRRSLKWLAVGFGVSLAWWVLVTLVIQPAFGRWGNNVVEIAYAGGSPARLGVYEVLLGNPVWVLEQLREGGLHYLYQMLRSVAFLAVLGTEGLLAAPTLAANLFFARMFPPAADPLSRFALLPACALVGATVVIVGRIGHKHRWDMRAFGVVVLLLVPSVSLSDGVKDAVRTRLEAHTVWNDRDALESGLRRIPATASVAAPHYALPALSGRHRLLYIQYLHMYQDPGADYVMLDRNVDRVTRNPALRGRYAALLEELLQSRQYEPVWQRGDYVLLRRIERTA